jgi:hypothetical protein
VLSVGGMSQAGFVDLGGSLTLDLPLPKGGGSYASVTANFVVGVSLPAL